MTHLAPWTLRLTEALGEPRWLIDLLPGGPPDVTYYVNTEQRAIALTIDDGPATETTPLKTNVIANVFCMLSYPGPAGQRARSTPLLQ